MDGKTRSALNKIAVAAQLVADEIDPEKMWWCGTADDFRRYLEWHKTRKINQIAARPLLRALSVIYPGSVSSIRAELVAAVCNHRGYSAPVGRCLIDLANALTDLNLEVERDADSVDSAAAARLRQAGERLEGIVTFVPSQNQAEILLALDGKSLTTDALQNSLNISRHTLFGGKNGKGGLNELMSVGLVMNSRKVGGYFRPDAPPVVAEAH